MRALGTWQDEKNDGSSIGFTTNGLARSAGRQPDAIFDCLDSGARSRTVVRLGDEFHTGHLTIRLSEISRPPSPIASCWMAHVRDVDPHRSRPLVLRGIILALEIPMARERRA